MSGAKIIKAEAFVLKIFVRAFVSKTTIESAEKSAEKAMLGCKMSVRASRCLSNIIFAIRKSSSYYRLLSISKSTWGELVKMLQRGEVNLRPYSERLSEPSYDGNRFFVGGNVLCSDRLRPLGYHQEDTFSIKSKLQGSVANGHASVIAPS
jgi:hypothetical protein